MWVSPFRYPRIKGYLLLPVAFRSLSRLSSALSAKASTLRSFQLNLSIRVRVCSLICVRSVGRLGSWFFSMCLQNSFCYIVYFDNNNLSFCGRTFTFFQKQRSCFLPRFWMSLSFNSLRLIMIIHYHYCIRFSRYIFLGVQLFAMGLAELRSA